MTSSIHLFARQAETGEIWTQALRTWAPLVVEHQAWEMVQKSMELLSDHQRQRWQHKIAQWAFRNGEAGFLAHCGQWPVQAMEPEWFQTWFQPHALAVKRVWAWAMNEERDPPTTIDMAVIAATPWETIVALHPELPKLRALLPVPFFSLEREASMTVLAKKADAHGLMMQPIVPQECYEPLVRISQHMNTAFPDVIRRWEAQWNSAHRYMTTGKNNVFYQWDERQRLKFGSSLSQVWAMLQEQRKLKDTAIESSHFNEPTIRRRL